MLSTEDYWAIILSLVISFTIAVSIAFFLWRGNRRLKKAREEAKAQRSRNNHEGAQVCTYKVIQLCIPNDKFRKRIFFRTSLGLILSSLYKVVYDSNFILMA